MIFKRPHNYDIYGTMRVQPSYPRGKCVCFGLSCDNVKDVIDVSCFLFLITLRVFVFTHPEGRCEPKKEKTN